jgi:hypothetical protein
MPQNETVTWATNLDTGQERAREKAEIAKEVKEQRMPSLGKPLRLHLEHLKPNKPMQKLAIGVQATSAGSLLTPQQRTLPAKRC